MARLLIIDDERDLHEVLRYHLEGAGYEVHSAFDGKAGLDLARSIKPDVIVLDVMLPGMSGNEVCAMLRTDATTAGLPILMLSARGEVADRVVGLETGADDYVVKPFSAEELLLRVRALLRRSRGDSTTGMTHFGRLKMDRNAYRAWVDEKEVELSALELRLLCTLLDRRPRVQSRHLLLEELWQGKLDVGPRVVDTTVSRLRERLEGAAGYIVTVYGAGYRFVGSPEEADR